MTPYVKNHKFLFKSQPHLAHFLRKNAVGGAILCQQAFVISFIG